jgi:hypothetical protein
LFISPALAGELADALILVDPVPVTFDDTSNDDSFTNQQTDSSSEINSNSAKSSSETVVTSPLDGFQSPIRHPTVSPPSPDTEGGLLARRQLYFEFNSDKLTEKYQSIALSHAKFISKTKGLKMKLIGNCDERGSREYNIALGLRRAESVMQFMVLNGAKSVDIETQSLGSEKPKAEGHNEESWALNRRVDIIYGDEE